jgi:Ser/Thr protein kinase RdoA (MazF antagonist)
VVDFLQSDPKISGHRPMKSFLHEVADVFALGTPVAWRALPDRSTNLTWHLRTTEGRHLIKQFRYPASDTFWRESLVEATRFESAAHDVGVVGMALPCRSVDDNVIEQLTGTYGRPALVRVHEWVDGTPVPLEPPPVTIAAAGRQLAAVQDFATRYSRQSTGSLLWWDWEPERWLAALADQRAIGPTEVSEGRTALAEALELVHAAEQSAINWTMCHYDHKPNNVHCTPDGLVLLDWDEAAMCPPRCEVVEAALLWATTSDGVDRRRLDAFLNGFSCGRRGLDDPTESDMGKWLASKVGWFDYSARRALRELPCTDWEADISLDHARTTLTDLAQGLDHISSWIGWMA